MLFLGGGTFLLLLPFLAAYSGPFHGQLVIEDATPGQNVAMVFCFAWLVADIIAIGKCYNWCAEGSSGSETECPE